MIFLLSEYELVESRRKDQMSNYLQTELMIKLEESIAVKCEYIRICMRERYTVVTVDRVHVSINSLSIYRYTC